MSIVTKKIFLPNSAQNTGYLMKSWRVDLREQL